MKKFYLKMVLALQLVLLAAVGIIYLASRQETTEFIGEKLLKPQGIKYGEVKGTLYEGMTLYDVNITEGVRAKKIVVRYKLARLLLGTPSIDEVSVSGLYVESAAVQSGDDTPEWGIPPFAVRKVRLEEGFIDGEANVSLSFAAEDVRFDGTALGIKSLRGEVLTRYGRAAVNGSVSNSVLQGLAHVSPSALTQEYYLPYVASPPEMFDVKLEQVTVDAMRLQMQLPRLKYAGDANFLAERADVRLDYLYGAEEFDLALDYRACGDMGCAQVAQLLHIFTDGRYSGSLEATQFNTKRALPFERLHADYRGDNKTFASGIAAGKIFATLKSDDYKTYGVRVAADGLSLAFVPSLPPQFSGRTIDFDAEGSVRIGEDIVFGARLGVSMQGTDINGTVQYADNALFCDMHLDAVSHSPLGQLLGPLKVTPLHLLFAFADEKAVLLAENSALNLTLLKEHERLAGWGNFYTAVLEAQGTVDGENRVNASLRTAIPSLYAFADAIKPVEIEEYEFYDAELNAETTLSYGDALRIESNVTVPWYALVFDPKIRFYGAGSKARLTVAGNAITVEEYSIDVANRRIFAKEPSQLRLDENLTLRLEPLRVFDSLEVRGSINGAAKKIDLHLYGKRFAYSGPEGSLTLGADVRFGMDSSGEQRLEGKVEILEGVITYVPLNDIVVNDDDIIIIQDVRLPSTAKRFVNLRIVSQNPLRYETPQVRVMFRPDVTIWKEPGVPAGLLGMVQIDEGRFVSSGKEFALKPSNLYFGGSYPVNPFLDLYADYVYDELIFHIYITHMLESPVFLFSSEPAMSQNDIMSYILFGKPSQQIFSGAGGESSSVSAANLLLGTGLKDMIGDTTGIKVDTLNLLSTPEGEMGFEVGAKIYKDLRVVYKNDTVSNLLLQYRLNRWLRLDVEIYETGQGVNVIYVKDFKAFERD